MLVRAFLRSSAPRKEEAPDLNKEIDFAFAQFDHGAAKAAFSTFEGPVGALR
jgi:hypothetical protein